MRKHFHTLGTPKSMQFYAKLVKSMVIALEILRKSWGKVTATQSRQDFSEMNER